MVNNLKRKKILYFLFYNILTFVFRFPGTLYIVYLYLILPLNWKVRKHLRKVLSKRSPS